MQIPAGESSSERPVPHLHMKEPADVDAQLSPGKNRWTRWLLVSETRRAPSASRAMPEGNASWSSRLPMEFGQPAITVGSVDPAGKRRTRWLHVSQIRIAPSGATTNPLGYLTPSGLLILFLDMGAGMTSWLLLLGPSKLHRKPLPHSRTRSSPEGLRPTSTGLARRCAISCAFGGSMISPRDVTFISSIGRCSFS